MLPIQSLNMKSLLYPTSFQLAPQMSVIYVSQAQTNTTANA